MFCLPKTAWPPTSVRRLSYDFHEVAANHPPRKQSPLLIRLGGRPHKEGSPTMEKNLEELKAHLMETDEEFRRLVSEHAQHKKRVEELESRKSDRSHVVL